MENLVTMVFGSHLYGTDTPQSDTDRKSVHIPDVRDILLQRVVPTISTRTKSNTHSKNTSEDIDRESFSLHKFLQFVVEGQTVALDMLFCPENMVLETSPTWKDIQAHRNLLISRQCKSFLGYARTQANKYGIRGSRVAAAREGVALIDRLGQISEKEHNIPWERAKLKTFASTIYDYVVGKEFTEVTEIKQANGAMEPHLEICSRKAPFSITLKEARAMFQRIVDTYGHRALLAEKNEGIDWKALSHAVRVGRQAEELVETGFVTFPRPERQRLLAIKLGQINYREVATEIEGLLETLEAKAAMSSLPEYPDIKFLENFVVDTYRRSIVSG
jgi:hypothetical protein